MKLQNPPPVIASGRVVSFAVVDAGTFPAQTSSGTLDHPVAGIALCERLEESSNGFFLAFCNADWKMLGSLHSVSPRVALQALRKHYPDIHLHWQDTDVTVLQALAWIARSRAASSPGR